MPSVRVQQCLGALILLTLALYLGIKIRPREALRPLWNNLAGFFSGLLSGLVNAGGPPLVLWVLAHQWPKDRMRSAISAFTLLLLPVQLLLLGLAFGRPWFVELGWAFLFAPFAMLGTHSGNLLARRFSVAGLRWAMQVLLVLSGVVYLLQPLLRGR